MKEKQEGKKNCYLLNDSCVSEYIKGFSYINQPKPYINQVRLLLSLYYI